MAGGGTRHRFELTRLEIAGVVVSFAASFLVTFLLGVYAGRGLEGDPPSADDRQVRLPVGPANEGTPAREEELTFDRTLTAGPHSAPASGRAGSGERTAEGAAPTDGAQPGNGPAPEDLASAHRPAQADEQLARVGPTVIPTAGQSEKAERSRLGNGASGAGTTGNAADTTNGAATQEGNSARVEESGAARAPVPPSGSPAARVAVALARPVDAGAPLTGEQGGVWSVQVTATRELSTANDLVKRLKKRGYQAYVMPVRRQGATFYRVRVGHYPSLERANQAVGRLRREPGVPEAFVASD